MATSAVELMPPKAVKAPADADASAPSLERVIKFVTDPADLARLRPENVVSRFRNVVALKETGKDDMMWSFGGENPVGPLASASFEFSPVPGNETLSGATFNLRDGARAATFRSVREAITKFLGKPRWMKPRGKDPATLGWEFKDWQVVLSDSREDSEIAKGDARLYVGVLHGN